MICIPYMHIIGECHGSWRKPNGCTYDCKYAAEWCVGSEDATFIVNSTDDDGWIGIGFSMVYLMQNSSSCMIVYCIWHSQSARRQLTTLLKLKTNFTPIVKLTHFHSLITQHRIKCSSFSREYREYTRGRE